MNTRHQVNSYFAILIVTIVGSWATLILVRVMTSDVIAATFSANTVYNPLQTISKTP